MTGDKRTPPIVEQGYTYGVNVVDIGDLRVARGKTRRPYSTCPHLKLFYDHNERRIWCQDCETDVEPFDAFKMLVERFDAHVKRTEAMREEAEAALKHTLLSRAAKTADDMWRRRNLSPRCPHCSNVLLPEDFADRDLAMTSTDLERARREKEKSK